MQGTLMCDTTDFYRGIVVRIVRAASGLVDPVFRCVQALHTTALNGLRDHHGVAPHHRLVGCAVSPACCALDVFRGFSRVDLYVDGDVCWQLRPANQLRAPVEGL
jgi:hypothetical protein